MIYTFKEQTIIIFHFILLGIFLSMMIDSIHIFFNKIKIINYIIQFILWLIITYICIRYVNNISNGYIPFYFLLFFLIGYLIYTYLSNPLVLYAPMYMQNGDHLCVFLH